MTIDEFKARAEFFKRDSIIPQRILKIRPHKCRHLFKFAADSWVLPTSRGYVIAVDCGSGAVIRVGNCPRQITSIRANGSPYIPGGRSQWFGNMGLDSDEWAAKIEAAIP